MINKTTIKIPKKYQQLLVSVEKEYQMGSRTEYMYWAYPVDGYYFTDTECHQANGHTHAQLLQDIRTIEKCYCDECSAYWKNVDNNK